MIWMVDRVQEGMQSLMGVSDGEGASKERNAVAAGGGGAITGEKGGRGRDGGRVGDVGADREGGTAGWVMMRVAGQRRLILTYT